MATINTAVDKGCPKVLPMKKLVLSKVIIGIKFVIEKHQYVTIYIWQFVGTWYVSQGVPIEHTDDCVKMRFVKTSDTTFKAYVTEFSAE